MANEQRQPAGVINVRVRENDPVNLLDGERESEVFLVAFAPSTLEQTTVQQHRLARNSQNVARAGDFSCGANELDLHDSPEGRER
jgi:hypothetical protein